VVGPFLGSLGASAAIVGFVAGFGELMGYSLRFLTGFLADRSYKYWTFTIAGYAINVLAVPALALAGHWPLAARTGPIGAPPAMSARLPRIKTSRIRLVAIGTSSLL